MSVLIRPAPDGFTAEVTGLDLERPIPDDDVAAIDDAANRFGVLVFRALNATDDQHLALTLRLGELEAPVYLEYKNAAAPRLPSGIIDISNLTPAGSPQSRESRRHVFNLANQIWHSDSSFRDPPARYSLLAAHVVPPRGGETQFADMARAWDTLPPDLRCTALPLWCEHSMAYSRIALGLHEQSEQERAEFAPVTHPLVRRNPVTGRESLFLSAHAGAIPGWSVPEARLLLYHLTEHATRREFVHTHTWLPGDLVLWDNRRTMHRVRPYDATRPRDMRRTTTAGEPVVPAASGATEAAGHADVSAAG